MVWPANEAAYGCRTKQQHHQTHINHTQHTHIHKDYDNDNNATTTSNDNINTRTKTSSTTWTSSNTPKSTTSTTTTTTINTTTFTANNHINHNYNTHINQIIPDQHYSTDSAVKNQWHPFVAQRSPLLHCKIGRHRTVADPRTLSDDCSKTVFTKQADAVIDHHLLWMLLLYDEDSLSSLTIAAAIAVTLHDYSFRAFLM